MNPSLRAISLAAPDGARAVVYAHGAHVVSWVPAAGGERLFLSPVSEFRAGAAIRGGVPVVFPQFGGMGPLAKHGFARLLPWEHGPLSGGPDFAVVTMRLRDNDATRALWPHAFRAELRIKVGGPLLEMALSIANTGDSAFTFTTALHTYLQVADVVTAQVDGLAGASYLNTTVDPWAEGVQTEASLTFTGEVDRIYPEAPSSLAVRSPERVTRVEADGFPDAVVWNPGAAKCARLPDMQPGGYRRFVCVEAAAIRKPVSIEPGCRWQGAQSLIAE